MAEDNKTIPGASPKEQKAATQEKKNGSKLKEATPLEEGTVVSIAKQDSNGGKTDNYMWVEGTGESRHMPKGKKFEVQHDHGQKLISKGAAKETTAPPKPQPKAAKKKTEEDDDD